MEATINNNNLSQSMCEQAEPESRLHFYLTQKYNKTKFPFFNLGELYRENVFNRDEANKLFKEGKIKIQRGASGKLIELVV